VLLIFALSAFAWQVASAPISKAQWDSIRPGMTKADVLAIMGQPDSYDGNQLEYSKFLNAGWVEFAFDGDDVLVWKNDESAFGNFR